MKLFAKLMKDESGQGMVEYGLIIALVAVVIIAALTTMGDEIAALFDRIVAAISGVGPN